MIVTLFDGVRDNAGVEHETTPAAFINFLCGPALSIERSEKKTGLSFTGCRFRGTRAKANAFDATVIALDVDDGADIFDAQWEVEELGCPFVIYTTTKHNRDHNRFRVVIPLDRPVQTDEYELLWGSLQRRFRPSGIVIDEHTKDISRLSISPYRWTGDLDEIDFSDAEAYVVGRSTGTLLDVDAMLSCYPFEPPVIERKADAPPAFYDAAAAERLDYRAWCNAQIPRETLVDLDHSPIITEKALAKALSADKGARVYALLCSVVSVAKLKSIPVDADDLERIAEAYSLRVHRKPERGENRRDAERAIAFGQRGGW